MAQDKQSVVCFKGVMKSIANMWEKENEDPYFTDIIVNVEGHLFHCHKFILCSCSEFFSGLVKSGLKESSENEIVLKAIRWDIFQLVLKIIYTGEYVLTNDNIIDVWKTLDQLAMTNFLEVCENFVLDNMNLTNMIEFYQTAVFVASDRVKDAALSLMAKDFEEIVNSEMFVRLGHEDLYNLLVKNELDIRSEDVAVYAVFKWINFNPNRKSVGGKEEESWFFPENLEERNLCDYKSSQQHSSRTDACQQSNVNLHSEIIHCSKQDFTNEKELDESFDPSVALLRDAILIVESHKERILYSGYLLSACKLGLITDTCLDFLISQDIDNERVNKLVKQAMRHRVNPVSFHYFPSIATQRPLSSYSDGIIYCDSVDGNYMFFDLQKNKTYFYQTAIENVDTEHSVKMFVSDQNELFALRILEENSEFVYCVFRLSNKTWINCHSFFEEIKLSNDDGGNAAHFITHGSFLYFIFKQQDSTFIQKLKLPECIEETAGTANKLTDGFVCQSFAVYKEFIVLFGRNTAICFNTVSEYISDIVGFQGSGDQMTYFSTSNDTFALQSNGSVWKFSVSYSLVSLNHVGTLWEFEWDLHGSVFYNDTLYLFGTNEEDNPEIDASGSWVKPIKDIVPKVKVIFDEFAGQCIPIRVQKTRIRKSLSSNVKTSESKEKKVSYFQ